MADPELALAEAFRRALAASFGDDLAGVDPAIRSSQHADYQANIALGLKARLGRPPREIAQTIVQHLEKGDLIDRLEVAGPGFINVTLSTGALSRGLREIATGDRLGLSVSASPETIVVDYSSPNVAKELHVGHLRSTIIGDALVRVLEARGHHVLRQNHLGDWGTPFGMLIEHLLDVQETDEAKSVSELSAFYKAARRKFDNDPAFAERSRGRVVLLQGGDADALALWRRLVKATLDACHDLYAKLGVTLRDEHVAGESIYNPILPDVVDELRRVGLLEENDGAQCVFPPGFTNREGTPLPLIVQKKDGGYGYATTDLAALRHRIRKLGATRVLVVVGAPQAQHLAMVFETARLAGWLVPPARAEHVSFGSVLGADGKMFKTREGETVRLVDLLDEAVNRARSVVEKKNPELDVETREAVARMVGIGAVKHADLSSDRVKDYVFDYDRMLAFEGNTAPYLQYAHARIRSIFRKGDGTVPAPDAIEIAAPAERALALALLRFPTVVSRVETSLEPHQLCTYLYDLATSFSAFYEACPVLKAASDREKQSRLAVCELTARVIARGLDLLGIQAPDRM